LDSPQPIIERQFRVKALPIDRHQGLVDTSAQLDPPQLWIQARAFCVDTAKGHMRSSHERQLNLNEFNSLHFLSIKKREGSVHQRCAHRGRVCLAADNVSQHLKSRWGKKCQQNSQHEPSSDREWPQMLQTVEHSNSGKCRNSSNEIQATKSDCPENKSSDMSFQRGDVEETKQTEDVSVKTQNQFRRAETQR